MGGGVLWVTAEVPDRDGGGGNIRQAHLLLEVSRSMPVDLLVAGRVDDEAVRASVRRLVEVPVAERLPSPRRALRRLEAGAIAWGRRVPLDVHGLAGVRSALAEQIEALEGGHRAVLVHHQGLAPLLPAQPRLGRWLLHLFHVAGARARQAAEVAGGAQGALLRRDGANADRLERWAVGAYDAVVVPSPADGERLGIGAATVVPNGVDLARYRPSPLPSAPIVLLSGSLGYEANADGARWFAEEVWPSVRADVPEARLLLVGRAPTADLRARHGHDGIEVHADVPVMEPWIRSARIAVVPLRIGTGTRVKALEAMASGRPVVGTSVGLEGLGLGPQEASVADDPDALARAVTRLLEDDDLAARRAAAGRALVEARWSWSSAGTELLRALDHR